MLLKAYYYTEQNIMHDEEGLYWQDVLAISLALSLYSVQNLCKINCGENNASTWRYILLQGHPSIITTYREGAIFMMSILSK